MGEESRRDEAADDAASVAPTPSGSDDPWSILSLLLSGVLLYGGIGWVVDRWLDTSVFTPIGILGGAAAAIYLVFMRYAKF